MPPAPPVVDTLVARPASALAPEQRAVVELDARASGTVIGAPGTGKTHALLARAERLLGAARDPADLLVLAPTRQTATVLRDVLSARVTRATPGPLARSLPALAFEIVRRDAVGRAAPPPRLLTAGVQDGVLADLLAGDAEDDGSWPEGLGPAVRASRDFRAELRALYAACAENDVDAAALEALGAAHDRPAWVSAARLLRDYRFMIAHAYEHAGVREAADLLADAVRILDRGDGDPPRILLVDDAQELTRGGVELLAALRRRGSAVLAFGDPDIASGSFRGASPALFAELAGRLGHVHVLRTPHRQADAGESGGELLRVIRTVTSAIGAAGRVEHRVAPGEGGADAADDSIRAAVAESPLAERDLIARSLRSWRLRDDVPWSRMAVIAHDTNQVAELAAELAAREVPTRAASVPCPLGAEAAVRDILQVAELGLRPGADRAPEALTAALLSPYGGLDAVGLRRLRALVRADAVEAAGAAAASGDLLVAALEHPRPYDTARTREERAALRLSQTLADVHAAAAEGASVHELLWTIWQRSGLERDWVRQAEGRGAIAALAERSLDALVALFGAAKRFSERADASGERAARAFIARILDSEVPEDMLSAPERDQAVQILTPAAALGTAFDVVVVAGVQEGVWPNTALRGGLLDAPALADVAAAARRGEEPPRPELLDRRRELLSEELRLFVRALSRARRHALVTSVEDDDAARSSLYAFLPTAVEGDAGGHPLTLRGLVARHRRTLTEARDPALRAHAAGQLALLARAGVAGADPQDWYGIAEPTTTAPLVNPAVAPARISPSRLEAFEACELDWAIGSIGGASSSASAGVGTLLHAALEREPDGDLARLGAVVDERWGEIPFDAAWAGEQERAWADTLTARLARYTRTVADEGGEAVGAEARFLLAVELPGGGAAGGAPGGVADTADAAAEPRVWVVPEGAAADDVVPAGVPVALVSGSIDRVERYPAGRGEALPVEDANAGDRVVVIDLKTGRHEMRVSDEKVADDAQLLAYQLALDAGAVAGAEGARNAGARLLVVSRTLKGGHYRLAHQPPLDADARAAFLRRLQDAAAAMAATTFTARVDDHCRSDAYAPCRCHVVPAVSAP